MRGEDGRFRSVLPREGSMSYMQNSIELNSFHFISIPFVERKSEGMSRVVDRCLWRYCYGLLLQLMEWMDSRLASLSSGRVFEHVELRRSTSERHRSGVFNSINYIQLFRGSKSHKGERMDRKAPSRCRYWCESPRFRNHPSLGSIHRFQK